MVLSLLPVYLHLKPAFINGYLVVTSLVCVSKLSRSSYGWTSFITIAYSCITIQGQSQDR